MAADLKAQRTPGDGMTTFPTTLHVNCWSDTTNCVGGQTVDRRYGRTLRKVDCFYCCLPGDSRNMILWASIAGAQNAASSFRHPMPHPPPPLTPARPASSPRPRPYPPHRMRLSSFLHRTARASPGHAASSPGPRSYTRIPRPVLHRLTPADSPTD